jgi:hypothetical protein
MPIAYQRTFSPFSIYGKSIKARARESLKRLV